MSKSVVVRIVLAFVLSVFATVMIRNGALGLSEDAQRISIAAVWVVGVAWMIWTASRRAP